MSSRAGKMEKNVLKASMPPQETKEMVVRIDVDLYKGEEVKSRSTYMVITGVPKDLPEEYENTVIKTAEKQFAQVLNQRLYLEFYNRGKTNKDEQPVFFNLSRIDEVKVAAISKVE